MNAPIAAAGRYHRVLRIARADGWSLVAVAGPAAIGALIFGDRAATLTGLGITLCGAVELNGRARLKRSDATGLRWLVAAQLSCLFFLLMYAVNLAHAASPDHLLAQLPAFTKEQLALLLPEPAEMRQFLLFLQRMAAIAIGIVALLYQGGLALFYGLSRGAIRAALTEPPLLS